jgi:hypothetical protein
MQCALEARLLQVRQAACRCDLVRARVLGLRVLDGDLVADWPLAMRGSGKYAGGNAPGRLGSSEAIPSRRSSAAICCNATGGTQSSLSTRTPSPSSPDART